MYFSIRPILWATDRYKAEYIIPFVILGSCLIYTKLTNYKKFKYLISIYALILLLIGSYGFLNYKNPNQLIIQTNRYPHPTEFFYDYKTALVEAKNEGFSSSVIISGNTSGIMPQIISGYTLNEVIKSRNLIKLPIQSINDWTSVDPILVNNQSEIKLILITDSDDKYLADKLRQLGWTNWKKFFIDDGRDVVGIVRGGYSK
jgi:hypothetical protein